MIIRGIGFTGVWRGKVVGVRGFRKEWRGWGLRPLRERVSAKE